MNTKAMNDINEILKKCPQIKDDKQLTDKIVASYNEYQA